MPASISMQIIMRIRQINRALSKHSKYLQDNYRITIPQLLCLKVIHQKGPIPLGELTRVVYLNNSTVTGIVDRLEKRGLVKRNRISRDRRQIHVTATEEGRRFLEKAPSEFQDRFLEQIGEVDSETADTILNSLTMIIKMLGGDLRSGGTAEV